MDAAERLAPLVADVPEPWLEELDRKAQRWRAAVARATAGEDEGGDDYAGPDEPEGLEESPPEDDAAVTLSDADDAQWRTRVAAAPEDASALLLVGLVRANVDVTPVYLRQLFWARPLSPEATARAAERITDYDEDRLLLESAVKSTDGFFTTFFVSPYSKYIARWAARRGFTPNQVTTVSMLLGVLAAAAFATGERWGLVAGAVLLQVSFTTDCVDGQLARYTRQFSRLGAWLDSVFDRGKEYVVFAGLAIGAHHMGDQVWLLACAALALQTVRHSSTSRTWRSRTRRSRSRRRRRSNSRSTTRACRLRRAAPHAQRAGRSRRPSARRPRGSCPRGTRSTARRPCAGSSAWSPSRSASASP